MCSPSDAAASNNGSNRSKQPDAGPRSVHAIHRPIRCITLATNYQKQWPLNHSAWIRFGRLIQLKSTFICTLCKPSDTVSVRLSDRPFWKFETERFQKRQLGPLSTKNLLTQSIALRPYPNCVDLKGSGQQKESLFKRSSDGLGGKNPV